MKKISLLVCVLLSTVLLAAGKTPRSYTLPSPDGTLEVTVTVDETLSWSLSSRGKLLLAPSAIGLELSDGTVLGGKAVKKTLPPVDREVEAQVYKKACVQERYNAMTLSFKNFDVEFRAYEEGAAYRIVPKVKGPFRIAKETAAFTLPADGPAWIPYVNGTAPGDPFATSFESLYSHSALSAWESGRLAFLPILVQSGDKKLLFTESGLTNYPGMFLCGEGTTPSCL